MIKSWVGRELKREKEKDNEKRKKKRMGKKEKEWGREIMKSREREGKITNIDINRRLFSELFQENVDIFWFIGSDGNY